MSQQSQIRRAVRIGLVALCATAVYEITKQICFPRMSLVTSHIVTVFFAGCAGFCISFIIRQRKKIREQELLKLAAIVQHSDDAIIGMELMVPSPVGIVQRNRSTVILLPKHWAATFHFLFRKRNMRSFACFCKRLQPEKP